MGARRRAAQRHPAARLLAALVLALALGGAHAVDCEFYDISPETPQVYGLRLDGPETAHSCGAPTYRHCYNECLCSRRNAMQNSSHHDCMFVNYWKAHPRCGGQALCQQIVTITRPVPEAGVRSGLAGASSPEEFDFAVGTDTSALGAWIEADASMLINKHSCNSKASYEPCQLQCLMRAECIAWMWGVDDDMSCISPLDTCPNKPLKGCKRGYCLLFSGYYEVNKWKAMDDTGHPGNWVGVIPGRPNPAKGWPNPRGVTPMNLGDMYQGSVEVAGLSHAKAMGFSLPSLAFDFGAAVGGGRCDAAGNCAHNLACDLFVTSAAECSALCEAANEKVSATLDALLARSDVNRSALEAAGQPLCKFYRWTEKELSCGASGLKKGECLLMSSLAGMRGRRAQDNSLKRVFGVLDMNDLPSPPPPSPRPPSPPAPPAPPPPEPPVVLSLDIGVDGTTKQQFGPGQQQRVEDVLEQNSGGGTASILSITDVPTVKPGQQRNLLAGGIVIKTRLLYPKRQAANAQRFARAVVAGGPGTAWVKQISPRAVVDSSSVKLQGKQVLLPPPPQPSPPQPVQPPPPRGINSGGGGRAGGGARPGGGSVRPVQGRAAMEVQPAAAAAALAAAPCSSVFFSLPKLLVGGTPHLAAYSDASPQANAAWGLAYCQQRNASFGAAGTVRRGVLPPSLAAHAAAVLTYLPADGSTCIGRDCPFVAVVECVPGGAAPCAADERGNVGVGNTGSDNVGHYNAGSHNLGSRNSGSGNIGDMNAASDCVGSYNTADGSFGLAGSGALVRR